jgi:hypothetical protein
LYNYYFVHLDLGLNKIKANDSMPKIFGYVDQDKLANSFKFHDEIEENSELYNEPSYTSDREIYNKLISKKTSNPLTIKEKSNHAYYEFGRFIGSRYLIKKFDLKSKLILEEQAPLEIKIDFFTLNNTLDLSKTSLLLFEDGMIADFEIKTFEEELDKVVLNKENESLTFFRNVLKSKILPNI